MNSSVVWKSIAAIVAVLLVLTLASCSGGKKTTENGNVQLEHKKTVNKPIHLTFWHTWEDSPENEVLLKRAEAFQKQHPEIKLEMESIPHDQYKIKLKTQAAGKQLPDLFQVWAGAELSPLVEAGVVMPIDDIVDNWRGKLISVEMLKDYAVDGKQYAIPGNKLFTHAIYYDKDKLAQAGFSSFPSTYGEFKTLITKLREKGITPIALGNKGKWVLQSCYISTIGDRFTGSDFLLKVMKGEAKFTDPEFVAGLSVIKELADLKAFNADMNSIDNFQQRDSFLQGKAAMMVEGTWAYAELKTKLPKDMKMGVAVFPAVNGGKGDQKAVSGVTGVGVALNSNLTADKKAAAQEFLRFFYSEELYKQLLSAGITVPANVEIPGSADESFKEMIAVTSGKIAPVYDATLTPELTDIINNGLQALTTHGGTKPEKVAKEMQNALKK